MWAVVFLVGFLGCGTVVYSQGGFEWSKVNGALRLSWETRPVLQYNVEIVQPPEGGAEVFARNAYIHPLWNPRGDVVTDDFPPDHYHQRGLFLAWTKTEFGDLHPDFWNLGSKTGRIVHQAVEIMEANAASATLRVTHEWQALQKEEWLPVLTEHWTIQAHAPAMTPPEIWVLDLISEQQCASDKPLVLPQYFYGGMAYRGSRHWLDHPELVTVLTSEGLGRLAANETSAKWCLMGGPLEHGFGGVTMMDHPDNPRFPNRLRVHPKVPYFGFMLPQAESYVIEPTAKLRLRYRILVHAVQPDEDTLNMCFDQWIAHSSR
ncbi:MAG: PmoA family protein [Candidatus Zipacnadales bacterium]